MTYPTCNAVEEAFLEKEKDEFLKWPICGKFNPVEKAIKNLREYLEYYNPTPEEYSLALESELSRVVNNSI